MQLNQKITPFLSFENQAEEAANFYVSLIPGSKILRKVKNPATGDVMTIEFRLGGIDFVALNTGQPWKFTEAFSMCVACETQEEIDTLWNALCEGGKEVQCGWLTDKFGVSWQVVPSKIGQWLGDSNPATAGRAMEALMQMVKLDLAKLEAAYEGR